MNQLTKYRRLWSFYDHDLLMLSRAEQLGEDGIEKRLKELGDAAKEIDELREMKKLFDVGNAFQSASFTELKRMKLKQIEDCKSIIKRLEANP